MRADDARWLISLILVKTANRDTDPWGLVRLDSQILRRVMYKHDATDVIRALEHGGAIETAAYCTGVKCKGYRLAKRYLGDRCVRMPVTDPRLLGSIERERQRLDAEEQQARWKPIHYRLNVEQRCLTIDDAADVILAGLPDHARLCQDVLVGNIRRREFPFSVGTTRRVFNAITGLKRDLRPALRIGGEPLGSVDIRCAQPGLLAIVFTSQNPPSVPKPRATYKHEAAAGPSLHSCPLPPLVLSSLIEESPLQAAPGRDAPPLLALLSSSFGASDVADFCELASSGTLYERLVALSGLERDAVKLAFLRDVLAKRGHYPSAVENAFRAEFPSVHRAIRYINRRDHGELIRLLQRMESWLVVENVSPRLVGRVPCITLHDAIYSTHGNLAAVETAFKETFDELGCRLALKVEMP
jgi:hypothetical protein